MLQVEVSLRGVKDSVVDDEGELLDNWRAASRTSEGVST